MINDLDILSVFNEIFHTNFTNIEITRDQMPQWDSMKHAELIIKLQKKFKFHFKARDVSKITSLSEIKHIMQKI